MPATRFFFFAGALFTCLSICTADSQWLHKRWRGANLEQEDVSAQRNMEAEYRIRNETPIAMRKMPVDEGHMFHLEYWGFRIHGGQAGPESAGSQSFNTLNVSAAAQLEPPLLLHADHRSFLLPRFLPSFLSKRDFSCPNDTISCASINRPNTCCANGLTCSRVQNTGLGDVGCCAGSSCSGQVSPCPSGYSSCPGNEGGGCCVPGFECNGDVGCVRASTTTVMVQTLVVVTPSTTTTPRPTTTSTTSTTSEASSTTFTTPPPPTTTSTIPPAAVNPPVRATSLTSAVLTTTVPTTILATPCPTGFYQCAAFFNGGSCCRVGRDCATSSCPPRDATPVLNSNGVTVADAPTGAPPGGPQGGCANGWFFCGQDVGGGCCLSGFACGTASCTATGEAQASVSPIAKQNDASGYRAWSSYAAGLALGAALAAAS